MLKENSQALIQAVKDGQQELNLWLNQRNEKRSKVD